MDETNRPTVLFIEGGWSGPWVFARVQAGLALRGIRALTLPPAVSAGSARRPALMSREAHERVRASIRAIPRGVALAAHSGGGFEMTYCGNEPQVEHLIYMSALMPGSGIDVKSEHWRPYATLDETGLSTFEPRAARNIFFHALKDDCRC